MTEPPVQPGLTRRAVLGGLAGIGAASLLRPAAGIAAALEGRRSVFSRDVGTVAGRSGELPAPRRFELVGVEWNAPAAVLIELRTRRRGGGWSRWVTASTLGHGPDHPAARAQLAGEAIWTGSADYVELRASRPLRGVRLHFVSARPSGAAATAAAGLPLAQPVLDAGPGQPPIIARAAWAKGQAPPATAPAYGGIRLAFIHHTETPNGYRPDEVPAMLLSIFDYHRYVRGWDDIGYNFAVDVFGRAWEARAGGIDQAVVGAQAGGYNLVSTGVAVLGSFTGAAPPPPAIGALEALLAWKLSLHGVPTLGRVTVEVDPAAAFYTPFAPGAHVSLPRIAGHRDGDSTNCPGDAFYARLPALRPRVAALAGRPAALTLNPPRRRGSAAAPVVVAGRLALLSGAAIAGEEIEVQQLLGTGEATLARATTGVDGRWSAGVALTRNARLRALHRPAPAAASDPAEIGVAPAITLTVDSVAPLKVRGTIHPPKRHATIDVYAARRGRWSLAARERVAVKHGRFAARIAARIATLGPGKYRLTAHTTADAHNAAGSSPRVELSV